jgi:hypothetical protein
VRCGFPKRSGRGTIGARHVLALAAALSIAIASPGVVRAEGRPALRVLLVVERANDPLMARIQAEVAALGLIVVTSAAGGPLENSAREQRAVAAVRVLPTRKGVELWMADVTTGRTLTRQLIVDERPDGPDQTLVALQTAEILRTGLFPKADKAAPASTAVPAVPVTAPLVASAAPTQPDETRVRAGIGGLYSPGGVDTALQAWLSVQRRWRHGLGGALTLSGPIVRGSISGPEGHAQVGAYLAGVELCSSFLQDDSRWFLTGGLGGGIVNLRTEGSSNQPLQQTSASVFSGFGYARAEVGLKLSTWARLAILGAAGTTLAPVKIRFAGNQAGTWGSLLLASFLQFGVDWE